MNVPNPSRAEVSRGRIENLSDLVFGLALSIGALVLISKPPATAMDVINDVAAFTYGFMILILIWTRYTEAVSYVRVETPGMIRANILMLFLVAIEPYLFNIITSVEVDPTANIRVDELASTFYALDLGGLMAILAYFADKIVKGKVREEERDVRERFAEMRTSLYAAAILFAIAALPPFWAIKVDGTPLRYYLLLVPVILVVARSAIHHTVRHHLKGNQ